MTDTRMLIGSLSNDLFRVASLKQRGADKAAERFLLEAKRWAGELSKQDEKLYIKKIAEEIANVKTDAISMEMAEKYLMYGVLLQNRALHCE